MLLAMEVNSCNETQAIEAEWAYPILRAGGV
jgi:hypothetical protein